ncbi:MAG TPA: FHA domain-containing protein [bacterium]|nr:FHA domain-containing protein [bacterium]HPS29758.1 FHA domain-containing protein [bacterium]
MVLKLIVENDRNELTVYDFEGNYIAAGRSDSNDLVLKERNVSRHHFQLEIIDNRIIIEDRGSSNQTFVNDREIAGKMEIFVGDVITIGDYNVYLEQDEDSALKTSSIAKAGRKVAAENLLLAKSGYIGGKVFPVKGAETVIGSHASADVYLYGSDIPAQHSKLIFDGNIFLLVKGDYKGKYSLVVNDMEIDSVDMRNGDEIKVGSFVFEFIEKGEEYDPMPYQIIAEDVRKEKLRKDIKGIKSVHDDETTEITQVKRISFKKPLFIGIGIAAVIVTVVVIAVIIFLKKGSVGSEDSGMKKSYKIIVEKKVNNSGKVRVA